MLTLSQLKNRRPRNRHTQISPIELEKPSQQLTTGPKAQEREMTVVEIQRSPAKREKVTRKKQAVD